jgi:hypothetical protein
MIMKSNPARSATQNYHLPLIFILKSTGIGTRRTSVTKVNP